MNFFTCAIEGHQYPDAISNEHHIIPKALGGSDDPSNLVHICSGCHQTLHAIAHMMNNPKRVQEIEATTISLFPKNHDARMRMLRYATLVAREMRLKKETRKDPTDQVRVIIELPQRFLELLRLYGHDMPHKNGRPAGVETVLRSIVADQLSQKFPLLKSEIMEIRDSK